MRPCRSKPITYSGSGDTKKRRASEKRNYHLKNLNRKTSCLANYDSVPCRLYSDIAVGMRKSDNNVADDR